MPSRQSCLVPSSEHCLPTAYMYSRVFNAWGCPTGGCSLAFIFLTKNRVTGEAEGAVALCAMPAVCYGPWLPKRGTVHGADLGALCLPGPSWHHRALGEQRQARGNVVVLATS